jgi:hypothetical protein
MRHVAETSGQNLEVRGRGRRRRRAGGARGRAGGAPSGAAAAAAGARPCRGARTQHPRRPANIPSPPQPAPHTSQTPLSIRAPSRPQELYKAIAWPLYRIFGHAFDAFKLMVADDGAAIIQRLEEDNGGPLEILTPAVRAGRGRAAPRGAGGLLTRAAAAPPPPPPCPAAARQSAQRAHPHPQLTPTPHPDPHPNKQVKEQLLKNIKRRMTPQPLKIRADVEMTCFSYDGIERIKAAMRAAEAASTEDCPVKMKLVAPPLYVLTTQSLDKNVGVDVLTKACDACKAAVEGAKGKLVVKEAPRAVSERDDRLLAEKLEALEAANKEVDGDADDSEEGSEQEGMGDFDAEAGPATIEV